MANGYDFLGKDIEGIFDSIAPLNKTIGAAGGAHGVGDNAGEFAARIHSKMSSPASTGGRGH